MGAGTEGKNAKRAEKRTFSKAKIPAGTVSKSKVEDELERAGYRAHPGCPKPIPLEAPNFTLADVRAAIPAHLFVRSLSRSLMYTAWNMLVVGFLFTVARMVQLKTEEEFSTGARAFFWPIYWFLQGAYMTGIWVIAHECGHQSFSDYKAINDAFGTIFHSFLLVPYHNWRITHRRHHSNTGSCEHDEVFVPSTRSEVEETWDEILEHSPLWNMFLIVRTLTVGWMPGYLIFNASGPKKYRGKNANHFSPSAAFYDPKEKNDVIVSDVCFFLAAAMIGYTTFQLGFTTMVQLYFIPYMIVNLYLVLITLLQHTDVFVPHFREGRHTWLHGALCTVDRSFGWFLDIVLHHITDTHVAHHLFSKMPFYNAQEATEHLRKFLGPYYCKDDTPIIKALWRTTINCKFVEENDSVVFYKRSIKH